MRSFSIMYFLFAWTLGICYGFVLLSSATGYNVDLNIFENGQSISYKWHSTVLLNEKGDSSKNVGFYVAGDVLVNTVWSQGHKRILQIEVKSPHLNIKSRKAPAPDGFIPHTSPLESFKNKPYLVIWNRGKIEQLLIPQNEPTSLVNIKKGIASLFQFQILDGEVKETDASGECSVKYTSISPDKFVKTKSNCSSPDLPYTYNPEEILGIAIDSKRETEYQLDTTKNVVKNVKSHETHQMYVKAREELGNFVQADQLLTYESQESCKTLPGETIEDVLGKLAGYDVENLQTERDTEDTKEDFVSVVNELRDSIKDVGTLRSAKSFIKLVNVGRRATKTEINKVLGSKKNKNVLLQLYDVLGFVQTVDSHAAVTKNLLFDDEQSIDFSERYLWALGVCSQPNPDVLIDLVNKYKKMVNIPKKVKETLILTISSMAHKLSLLRYQDSVKAKILRDVEELIGNELDYAKGEERYQFFRALKNLRSGKVIAKLLGIIKAGSAKEGVLAWKAIKALNKPYWSEEVLKAAKKTFFQLDKKHDSSSRTIAAEILLELNPSDQLIEDFLHFLYSNDGAYEVKQYVWQTMRMIADENSQFKQRLLEIIKRDSRLNNYSTLNPRGMSTALTRSFMKGPSSNGSLISLQELKGGIVKRGTVNVIIGKEDLSKELFSLGIFAGGLSSFMSSSSNDNEEADDESANAGMELTVLGTQIRPFVFFSGQGELMGHVWSGTASERTTAYQALLLLQDHLEYIRLASGPIAELNIKGATSFDLSGLIKISIFYSTADALVEKSAGIFLVGTTKVDTSFVKSQVEFTASIEPKLNLQTDIDFSSKMNLCMRLTQPDSTFKHNIFKIERIPESKHKLRIAKYKKTSVPGLTYSLNRKNNEMCSAIFK